ncbi:hypothetical protein VB796_15880 [Arcicella sp. LKC2W]|uniref:hypothetical protein n=1 Tax=Arcicella sp. LKC2W TaxID=2984198 RepID=UPI002B1FAC37|nr:hypothetical protein [Arcicella sp. LKC2W]MEA5460535.1 hypothetical protein [Arcicella sp. LKC2W]
MANTNPITTIHDEVSIIDFLVDNNAMIKEFSKSQFVWVFIEEDFHIVLFLAESSKTHFEKYVVERFSENMNDMIALWNRFDQQIQQGIETRILKLAKNKVHDLIAMSETFRALFNRKDFDEE